MPALDIINLKRAKRLAPLVGRMLADNVRASCGDQRGRKRCRCQVAERRVGTLGIVNFDPRGELCARMTAAAKQGFDEQRVPRPTVKTLDVRILR